jgi:hypothetical protein
MEEAERLDRRIPTNITSTREKREQLDMRNRDIFITSGDITLGILCLIKGFTAYATKL